MDRDRIRSNQFLVLGLTLWLALNLTFRWLYWPIFQSHGPFGIAQPSLPDLALLLACTLCSTLLFALVGLLLGAVHARWGAALIAVYAALSLIALEADIGWYAMSKSHVTLGDLQLFLTQSWQHHFGIQRHDIWRFYRVACAHLAAVGLIYYMHRQLRRHAAARPVLRRLQAICAWRHAFALLLVLVLLGQSYTMLRRGGEYARTVWDIAASANPYYISAADRWLREARLPNTFVRFNARLQAARGQARTLKPLALPASLPLRPAPLAQARRPDILFLTIESWNVNLADQRSMPYFSSLAQRCHIGTNHYSGANQTELGILSLLYGDPTVFFAGYRQHAAIVRQSPYIEALGKLGYRTGRVVSDMTQQNTIPRYLASFNQAEVVNQQDWENIHTIAARLRHPDPAFIHAHYYATHYPYLHAPHFSAHRPETPSQFNFQSSNLAQERSAIINRYRNTLGELDAWLNTLLQQIDLASTIVVITGDHGEEMFETGRLGHASTLDAPQIRTPLAICAPASLATTAGASAQLSSHADIFPTIFDMLGFEHRLSIMGRSLLGQQRPRVALVSKQNHGKTPVQWAAVTPAGTLYLTLASDGTFAATGSDAALEVALSGTPDGASGAQVERLIIGTVLAAERELRATKRQNP
ncbi:sulfatase-like hydrolase/transferase [Janthinobacterium sp. HLX7-2]|uniref:sulfatase-like hydrolase/transferase n=1 Tax=Janthinobacterium sp. HLX7-2 TaxID=1259331 RepID=UPI003F230C61